MAGKLHYILVNDINNEQSHKTIKYSFNLSSLNNEHHVIEAIIEMSLPELSDTFMPGPSFTEGAEEHR